MSSHLSPSVIPLESMNPSVLKDFDWPASDSDNDNDNDIENNEDIENQHENEYYKVCRRVSKVSLQARETKGSRGILGSHSLLVVNGQKQTNIEVVLQGWLMPRAGMCCHILKSKCVLLCVMLSWYD